MQFVTESVLLSSLPDLVQVATREELDRCMKAHLNTLFHSKTGNLIRGEEYSKLCDEDVIKRLDEAKKKSKQ